jgi:hypothetical protein
LVRAHEPVNPFGLALLSRANQAAAFAITVRRPWPSFSSSKASTIPHAATPPWAIFRPSNTKGNIMA